mmetsp:Transcript_5471/g.9908  ORF Transcript_5471/g.9908 Transcript_5471/m.9908 type:complete len:220 (-) Transcript_5471:6-665(-)
MTDGPNGFLGAPHCCNRVHCKPLCSTDCKCWQQAAEIWCVGVLDECHPLFAVLLPFLNQTTSVEQCVDIPMPMGLCLQHKLITVQWHEMRSIITEAWDLLLLDNHNLAFWHPKICVTLQKCNCLVVSVIRCHQHKWNGTLWHIQTDLDGLNPAAIIFQIRNLGDEVNGKLQLDARVSQSFTQPTSHQHHCCMPELCEPFSFKHLKALCVIKHNCLTIRD